MQKFCFDIFSDEVVKKSVGGTLTKQSKTVRGAVKNLSF